MMTKIYAAKLKHDLLRLAVFSLITVVIWLSLVTYRALTKSQVNPDVKKQLTPLTSSLELDTMDQVSQRLKAPAIDWDSLGQTALVVVVEELEAASGSASVSGQINQ